MSDPAAFLPGETGARLVSEADLRGQGPYPLQVKTVEVTRTAVASLLLGLLRLWVRRRFRAGRQEGEHGGIYLPTAW